MAENDNRIRRGWRRKYGEAVWRRRRRAAALLRGGVAEMKAKRRKWAM